MRAVVQRVSSASVTIDGQIVSTIGPGLLVFLGVANGDTPEDAGWLAQKIAALRIFDDGEGKMNLSVCDTGGEALVVSQFTLNASTRKGNRPSFNEAARPETAVPCYENFVRQLEITIGQAVSTGRFGAVMQVALVNAGPVTLVLDSRLRE